MKKRNKEENFLFLSKEELVHVFSFIPTDILLNRIIYVKKMFVELCYQSVHQINVYSSSLSVDDFFSSVPVDKFPNLSSLVFENCDTFLSKKSVEILQNINHLKEIVFVDCSFDIDEENEKNEQKNSLLSGLEHLENLIFDNCKDFPLLSFQFNLPKLKLLSFYDCSFIGFHDQMKKKTSDFSFKDCLLTPSLSLLKFAHCRNFTDELLFFVLNNFYDYDVEGLRKIGPPTDEIFNLPQKKVKFKSQLKQLELNHCSKLLNPNIQSNSIESLKILNCRSLERIVISCDALISLQIGWCKEMKDLLLVADNLKVIDFCGTLTKEKKAEKKRIIESLRQHFDDKITITV